MYHQAILWSLQEKSLELGSCRLRMRVMHYLINIQKNSIVYYKHFFRRQPHSVKEVYELPYCSVFENANYAASHLEPNLSVIGNLSKSTSVLMLEAVLVVSERFQRRPEEVLAV